jgi:hypothetical protein
MTAAGIMSRYWRRLSRADSYDDAADAEAALRQAELDDEVDAACADDSDDE